MKSDASRGGPLAPRERSQEYAAMEYYLGRGARPMPCTDPATSLMYVGAATQFNNTSNIIVERVRTLMSVDLISSGARERKNAFVWIYGRRSFRRFRCVHADTCSTPD
ncbi:hypothetical protein EVAR_62236_1 [Eumeta japonica]|uniref:Uncharacterized protein n=1 Tax=Eumeta variegata TaxID=151549 RepID=A0A4C1Z938_EUMVA|nr:hypothetical protein EVAR_62236_1 [Eumeta japonica]